MAVDVVKDKKKDMTNDVRKMSLFKLAWPVFVQCLLSLCLGYVDTLMISRYSSTAVGGLGNANQILGFLTLAFTVISSAAGVIIAQYIGAGLKNKLSEIYTVSIFFNLILHFGHKLFLSILLQMPHTLGYKKERILLKKFFIKNLL